MSTTRIYRNLHNCLLSIQQKGPLGRWRVVGYCEKALLEQAEFKVSQAGRERVLKELQKNVHAYVVGKLVKASGFTSYKGREPETQAVSAGAVKNYVELYYNPYMVSQFSTRDAGIEPVYSSDRALVKANGKILAGWK